MANLTRCTVFELAQKSALKVPIITIPYDLRRALENQLLDYDVLPERCRVYIECIKNLFIVEKLDCLHYIYLLKTCLYLEQFEIDLKMKRHRLLNHAIEKWVSNDSFVVTVPSLSSEDPIITPDDKVILYDIVKKKSIPAKVIKVVGHDVTMQLFSPKIRTVMQDKEKRFNINFLSQLWPLRCCHYALMIFNYCHWKNIIYPQLRESLDLEDNIKWVDTNMQRNEEQTQAITKILNKTAYPAPYIIFGPPGTGKTATLVQAIYQICKQYPTKNILVCTASNAAADEITKRLIKSVPINIVHRMYAPSRKWNTIDKEIQPCANFVDEIVTFLSRDLLSLKKIIITTLVTSLRLKAVNFRENHFSYIIIDEASQATEPEMLIPLAATVKLSGSKKAEFHAQLIIAGDPYQLGPIVHCKKIEHLFGKSMLERLMDECDVYKKQDGKYNPNYITKLVKNYRSHEDLLYVSNKQFYDDDLKACGGADIQIGLNWSKLPNKNFPMIFQEVRGTEERSETKSVHNIAEVLVVIEYVKILIKTKFGNRKIMPKDIGIVTPFRRQQLRIVEELQKMNLTDITVGTVERFQGQERTVMIVSTVRSQIFEHDGKEHIGFLSNPKRFNVALTRAKALMIIIGNSHVICTNEHWKVLWEYCKKHDAVIPFEQCSLKPDKIAKLEKNYKITLGDVSSVSNTVELSIAVKTNKKTRRREKKNDVACMIGKLSLTEK